MWRNSTVDARIAILNDRKESLEMDLIKSIEEDKAKKFITDSAEYVVMSTLKYCRDESYYFNIDHQGEVKCGILKPFNIKQFMRLKGMLLGMGCLYRMVGVKCKSKGLDAPKNINFSKIMKKAWKTIHDNDEIMADIDFDESVKIQSLLEEIALCITDEYSFESISKFIYLCNEADQLALFVGFMSIPNMSVTYNSKETKGNIYTLSNFTFYLNNGETMKKRYSKQLRDVCTVFQLYKANNLGLTFQPNEKYFFESNVEHRATCFMTIAILNKLAHRALNEMCKFELNGGIKDDEK